MKAKNWIKLWSTLTVMSVISLISVITLSNIPLRFSNSISYDVKLNFIRESKLLDNANTLVVGSSMALNNIDGNRIVNKAKKIRKIANLGAWALQSSEVLQLLKLIDLAEVEYIIYATQYLDFEDARRSKIDDTEVKSYLNNEFIVSPYMNTLTSIPTNISNYTKYTDIYLNPNKYTYLKYDKTGGINFNFSDKYIDKERWESIDKEVYTLDEACFDDLVTLSKLARLKGIKLIVLTTPYRASMMENNGNLSEIYTSYVERVKRLSKKHHFAYFNTHDTLNLDDKYFVDGIHLNKHGAALVSGEIINYLNLEIVSP